MLISFCIPVHNRAYDLKKTMPYLLDAAHFSPPVEIVILDYNSPDDLADFINNIQDDCITYRRYTGRNYYHMAHARNLSVMAASGEYIIIMSADIYPAANYIQYVREQLAKHNYIWMQPEKYKGAIVCQRQEFIEAGGYDERFEFYGPEDRDLEARLLRRGNPLGIIPAGMIEVIHTPDDEKIKNYRLQLTKAEMSKRMRPIFEENYNKKTLVANQGRPWGQWI